MDKRFTNVGKVILPKNLKKAEVDKTDITIHTSASRKNGINAKEIDRWHKERTPPFAGIGYHFVILENGTIQVGRNIEFDGAHVLHHNKANIGICWVGGFNGANNISKIQYKSLLNLVRKLQKIYSIDNKRVKGHKEFEGAKTDCPIINMQDFRKRLKPQILKKGVFEVGVRIVELLLEHKYIAIKNLVLEQIDMFLSNKDKKDNVKEKAKELGIDGWIVDILIKIALYALKHK